MAEDTDDDHPAVAGAAHRVADGQFEHAMRAVASGDFDHGLPLLLNCCRMEPGNLAFFQGLRRAQLARRAAAGLSPWCSPMKHWLLRVWLKAAQKLGRPLCVMQCAEQLLSRDPDDLPAQLALSEAADQAGFRPLAVWLLDSAHVSHPEHTNVSRQLARVLEETGDLHRAGALWETIARADVTDSEAHKKFRDLAADELRCQYHAAQQARRSSA